MRKSTHTTEYRLLLSELRSARRSAGLSQRDVAGRLKVPPSWVAKVEGGERRIDLVELCWFFAACGTNAADRVKALALQINAVPFVRPMKGRGSK
jgi:transcriptional regulator with XRE-family HTH domain